MFIKIKTQNGKYTASINTSNHSKRVEIFKTVNALDKNKLNEILLDLGFHQRDILDAFNEAEGKTVNLKHPFMNK